MLEAPSVIAPHNTGTFFSGDESASCSGSHIGESIAPPANNTSTFLGGDESAPYSDSHIGESTAPPACAIMTITAGVFGFSMRNPSVFFRPF